MITHNKSGNNGWVAVLAVIGGLFLAGRLIPVLSRLLSIFLGFGVLVLIAIIALVIYFSCRSGNKKEIPPTKEDSKGPKQTTNYRQPGTTGTTPNSGTNYGRNAGTQRAPQSPPPGKQQTPPPSEPEGAKNEKELPPCQLSPEAREILNKGRNHLAELRRLHGRIRNLNVKKRAEDICAESEKILGALQQQPEDISMVRQFFNYYLPALGNILLKYLRLEEAGMATEQTTVKVMFCLGEIKTAMEKQYAAIFENDILDLTVEMEALTQACKRDGLLVSEDFTIREGGREINLTI